MTSPRGRCLTHLPSWTSLPQGYTTPLPPSTIHCWSTCWNWTTVRCGMYYAKVRSHSDRLAVHMTKWYKLRSTPTSWYADWLFFELVNLMARLKSWHRYVVHITVVHVTIGLKPSTCWRTHLVVCRTRTVMNTERYSSMRQLRLVRSSLNEESAKTLVHAFVSSRLDYCNSLLYGVSDELLQKLQVIQNAAARVLTGARKFDHITPVLCELHWLPVRQRIRFKLAMIVYKCLHGLAPPYLADDCVLVSSVASRRHLRSADTRKLVVRLTRTVIGARNFATTFARHLKACLFRRPS